MLPALVRVGFTVEADTADAISDEAIWRDGEVVGWVTSGGYCHVAGRSHAAGYVRAGALAVAGTDATWEIEIPGDRCPAALQPAPLFDPAGARMRA